MSDDQMSAVIAYLDAIKSTDADAAGAQLAEGATYHVNGWNDAIIGREAIVADLRRQLAIFSGFDYSVKLSCIGSGCVFTEREDIFTMMGKKVLVHSANVFELARDGSIASIRDYFDSAEVAARLAPTA